MRIFDDIIEEKTVCFTGHRQVDYEKIANLSDEIKKAIPRNLLLTLKRSIQI